MMRLNRGWAALVIFLAAGDAFLAFGGYVQSAAPAAEWLFYCLLALAFVTATWALLPERSKNGAAERDGRGRAG